MEDHKHDGALPKDNLDQRGFQSLSSPLFGQSTQMLEASLGSGGQNGGLNPLYQIGGTGSVQRALKLLF